MERKKFRKKSHNAEKLKGGLKFFNIHSVAKHRKIEGGTLWGIFFPKKVSQCRKKIERGTLWSRPVWYVTREKNLFGSVR